MGHAPTSPKICWENTGAVDIRLVAVDLDGTLLNSQKKVDDRVANALRCLPERGVDVVIASARPPRSVRHIYHELKLKTWQINYNGALIWDEEKKQPIFHRQMDGNLVRRMIQRPRGLHDEVIVHCEALDRWCTDRINDVYTTETGKLFRPDIVADLPTFWNDPMTKVMLLGDPKIITQLAKIMTEEFSEHVSVVQTDPELLQMMDRRVSKSVALRKLTKAYGLTMDQVMAIGDAPNDVGMIQLAGVGVAMANAYDVVKNVADWVAPSNDDFGVHAALQRYGLCE